MKTIVDRGWRQALSHVVWIGGATDAGKTTSAQIVAQRHGCQVYHYDQYDQQQVEQLAQRFPRYRAFLEASLEERWVVPEPEELLAFHWRAFQDRFPLVVEDLLALPRETLIVAEGFGLTPELVCPILTSRHQAVWLVPSKAFKRASMARRHKPSFREQVSDPQRATRNVFLRDMMLAERVREQARARDLVVYEVDGTRSVEDIASLIERHFEPFFRRGGGGPTSGCT